MAVAAALAPCPQAVAQTGTATLQGQPGPVVQVDVGGRTVDFAVAGLQPYIDGQGRTEVPLRALGTALGAAVHWDGPSGTATLTWSMTPAGGAVTLGFRVGSGVMAETTGRGTVGIRMDTVPQDIHGRLAVPIRFVAQAIGFAAIWEGGTSRRVSLVAGDPTIGGLGYNTAAGARAALAAINNALSFGGDAPVTVPAGFWSLPAAQQFQVLLNRIRQDLGQRPLAWNSQLAALALEGAQANTDPPAPGGSGSYGVVWSGEEGPVQSLYTLLFNDGYGSNNLDCPTPSSAGCWIHRRVLLGHYGPTGQIGAAVGSVQGQISLAAVLMS